MENTGNFSRSPKVEMGKPKKKWLKPVLIVSTVLILAGGIFFWKAGSILNKV
ncbi:MAG: hypothetical protein ACD_9C00020G0001, partial [uncultured bacterium]